MRDRRFRLLFGGWAIGSFADSTLYLTLGIWAKDLTGSSGAAGLVFFCLALPVLVSPVLGHLADRVRRRPLLIAANLAAAALVLSLLGVEGRGQVPVIYAVAFGYGLLGSLSGAAQSGLVRALLPDEQLGAANAALMTVDQGFRLVTPLVGAGLYAAWGGPALAVGTAGLLVVTAGALALVRVREAHATPAAAGRYVDELLAGLRHLRRTPVLRRMVAGLAVSLGAIGMLDSVIFAVVDHGLDRPPTFFGVLMSVQGAGSIIGGVTANRLLRHLGGARTVGAALALFAVTNGLLLAGGWAGSVPIVLAGSVLMGVAIPWAFVALATTRQRLTPDHLQGRIASATGLCLQLPQTASIALGAGLVGLVDYRVLLLICLAVVASAAGRLLRTR
jgi:MFS family permease